MNYEKSFSCLDRCMKIIILEKRSAEFGIIHKMGNNNPKWGRESAILSYFLVNVLDFS